MFNESFKYYKARKQSPNLENVIDVSKPNDQVVHRQFFKHVAQDCKEIDLGLNFSKSWNIYEFNDIPGLILIQNPFNTYGQKKWIIQSLKEYTEKPYRLNIDAHNILDKNKSWWNTCFFSIENKKMLSKLRWATMGYHHNWDTKHYSNDLKTEVPRELKILTRYFSKILDFPEFNAEAAIINYYGMNSTMAGHVDNSEIFLEAPLFSLSFGQSAIFLIGGYTRDEQPNAILLRSGDVIVMSGTSRLKYHGVPRILYSDTKPWESKDSSSQFDEDWSKAHSYISEARINLNIRQVLKLGESNL